MMDSNTCSWVNGNFVGFAPIFINKLQYFIQINFEYYHFIRFVINFNLILLKISILIIELKYFVMNLQTIFIFE